MNRLLNNLLRVMAAVVLMTVACTDYGPKIDNLKEQVGDLENYCATLNSNAQMLDRLIAALASADELVSFAPISENGSVIGYKAVFKDSGPVVLYNQACDVSVGEEGGRYYWMAGGEWLLDPSGTRVEIANETVVPIFDADGGKIAVSVDGGKNWRDLGYVDKALITAVSDEADKVIITLAGGAVIVIPKPQALSIALSGDDATIAAGASVLVNYIVSGCENATVTVLCGEGWSTQVSALSPSHGTITITAPTPITLDKAIVFASDGQGRMVAVQMRLVIDTTPGDDPDDPENPDEPENPDDPENPDGPDGPGEPEDPDDPEPPAPEEPDPIIVPVYKAFTVPWDGDEVIVELWTNVNYTVTLNSTWIRYKGTRQTKDIRSDYLVFEVDRNEGMPRFATATISAGNCSTQVVFTQMAETKYLYLSQEEYECPGAGGSVTITVDSNVDYQYALSSDWVTVIPKGNDTFTFSATENKLPLPRYTLVTFSGKRVHDVSLLMKQEPCLNPKPAQLPGQPTVVCHLMPCCRVNNNGTKFLLRNGWVGAHDYTDISQVRDILSLVRNAGINVVSIDFTNASQWDDIGESALHNGDGGEFWRQFKPMLDNITLVCSQMGMEYFLFIGNTMVPWTNLSYWNDIAGKILNNWAQDPAYRHYGYGDDRPLLVMFVPGKNLASQLKSAPASQKNNLLQFHIGTCEINTPITPTTTDGWGYRNYSGSSDGKVRFACPNGGIPPQDWYRVGADTWRSRVGWALHATEYAVLGSYDDTCDAIFWGIADVSGSNSDYHKNSTTVSDPFIYYSIVRKAVTGLD